ncbi:hypothetical protein [uncultured Subdoligranulum sp.]|uniref:hypothetical protein n=1 Tax=uncultured Subdoligranulum sp. TaxID=512298 RepID=UPI0025DFCFE8|nr:hypothetical protein [uncultured Subdoligranulum sp.]
MAWRGIAAAFVFGSGFFPAPFCLGIVLFSFAPGKSIPPSHFGDKLFEVSSKVFQTFFKWGWYSINIDKTVPQRRYRFHRLRPCQGNSPTERGQQTRLRAII